MAAATGPVMLTRDPAELYREQKDRKGFISGRTEGGKKEELLPRLFVTKTGLETECVKLRGRSRNAKKK